jgi:hypothetical protein
MVSQRFVNNLGRPETVSLRTTEVVNLTAVLTTAYSDLDLTIMKKYQRIGYLLPKISSFCKNPSLDLVSG